MRHCLADDEMRVAIFDPDQNGKPFKPDPMTDLLRNAVEKINMLETGSKAAREFHEMRRLEQLRASCGEKPKQEILTFRRFLPYEFKA